MKNKKERIGNFTSSEIAKLMTNGKEKNSFGKPAYTYIAEKNMERKLGQTLNSSASARPLQWGTFLESRAFNLLGLEYQLVSQETIGHYALPFWFGSPDGTTSDSVIDIKCPYTLKSFCELVDCKTIDEVRKNCDMGEKYYWQLVSNAILTEKRFAELIIYCPYKSELEEIRESTQMVDGDQNKLAWINFAEDDDLPYLNDGGYYKNINIIRFEIPESDVKKLYERIVEASKLLIVVLTCPITGNSVEINKLNV